MKVLIVEDNKHTRDGLKEILAKEGCSVISAANGLVGVELFNQESPEFICLDIMMPKINGLDAYKAIRKRNSDVPIIFISAKSKQGDKVVGLELGADNIITKPLGIKGIVARIRASTRPSLKSGGTKETPNFFEFGDLHVFPDQLKGKRGNQIFELSLRDIRILQFLNSKCGKVISRDELFKECWGMDNFSDTRTLDQHISQLGKRIEIDPKHPMLIRTVHGYGYRYDDNDQSIETSKYDS